MRPGISLLQMEYFEKRYATYAEEGFPKCDELMIPYLKAINRIPGVSTTFCCEGHFKHPDQPHCYFYVAMAYTDNGGIVIERLWDALVSALEGKLKPYEWDELLFENDESVHPSIFDGKPIRYFPSIVIRAMFTTQRSKDIFFAALKTVLDQIAPGS